MSTMQLHLPNSGSIETSHTRQPRRPRSTSYENLSTFDYTAVMIDTEITTYEQVRVGAVVRRHRYARRAAFHANHPIG